jgi:hypothetical protein
LLDVLLNRCKGRFTPRPCVISIRHSSPQRRQELRLRGDTNLPLAVHVSPVSGGGEPGIEPGRCHDADVLHFELSPANRGMASADVRGVAWFLVIFGVTYLVYHAKSTTATRSNVTLCGRSTARRRGTGSVMLHRKNRVRHSVDRVCPGRA